MLVSISPMAVSKDSPWDRPVTARVLRAAIQVVILCIVQLHVGDPEWIGWPAGFCRFLANYFLFRKIKQMALKPQVIYGICGGSAAPGRGGCAACWPSRPLLAQSDGRVV